MTHKSKVDCTSVEMQINFITVFLAMFLIYAFQEYLESPSGISPVSIQGPSPVIDSLEALGFLFRYRECTKFVTSLQ